jgi:hypothetical protein
MDSVERQTLIYISAIGIVANITLFLGSFIGWTPSNMLALVLIDGGVMVGIGFAEMMETPKVWFKRCYWWNEFWTGMPWWGRPLYLCLFASLIGQFLYFALHAPPTVPWMVGGEPLLDANGQVVTRITDAGLLARNEVFLRFIATFMAANYYQSLMYYSFRRPNCNA